MSQTSIPPTIGQEHSNNRVTSNTNSACMSLLYFFSPIIFVIAMVMMKSELDHNTAQMTILSTKIDTMNSNFHQYQTLVNQQYEDAFNKMSRLESDMFIYRTRSDEILANIRNNVTYIHQQQFFSEDLIHGISTHVNEHDKMLVKLTNRTSNAEVLERLKVTQDSLLKELVTTKSKVSATLDQATKNVSIQLDQTHQQLDSSIGLMKGVVHEAEDHIHKIETNVTQQLELMTKQLNTTVASLNIAVMLAQATIHNEVDVVKDKIDEYVLATNVKFAAENDFVKYQLAGTFTLLGCLISLWHVTSHLRHYEKPDVQRRIMAVLWMVPIYGITSWLSLAFDKFEVVFSALRDCYEAYVVYTFIALLIAVLEDGKGLSELLNMLTKHVLEERREVLKASKMPPGQVPKIYPKEHLKPPFPCCYVYHKPSSVAAAWLYQCKLMAMQFVIMKPLLTALPVIMELSGLDYHGQPLLRHGQINYHAARVYVIILQNLSVAIAFYGLLSFYHGTEKDLAWCDPWPKFLCIKGVVFMTFWQGVSLQIMSTFGLVDDRVSSQIQNLLICIEMLLASIAHFYIFPYQEWQEGYKRNREQSIAIRDTLALKDFYKDMRQMVTRWETSTAADPSNINSPATRSQTGKSSSEEEIDALEQQIGEEGIISNISGDVEMNQVSNDYMISPPSSQNNGYRKKLYSSDILNPLFPRYDKYYQLTTDESSPSKNDESDERNESNHSNQYKNSSSTSSSSSWFTQNNNRYASTMDDQESISLLHSDSKDDSHVRNHDSSFQTNGSIAIAMPHYNHRDIVTIDNDAFDHDNYIHNNMGEYQFTDSSNDFNHNHNSNNDSNSSSNNNQLNILQLESLVPMIHSQESNEVIDEFNHMDCLSEPSV